MAESSLQSDPAFRPLIDDFVKALPERLSQLQAAMAVEDVPEIRRLAHQLSGAGGSYGFDRISQQAAIIESLACKDSVAMADRLKAIERLASTCETATREWVSK